LKKDKMTHEEIFTKKCNNVLDNEAKPIGGSEMSAACSFSVFLERVKFSAFALVAKPPMNEISWPP
jgi:hypothetical protein